MRVAHGTARVVVASAAALLPRVSAPERLLAASLELRPGQDIAPTDLAELLVDAGFTREDPADEHGEFAVRGGIVDIFPAGEAHPVRLEFIGDTIESLRTYDPATQRSIAPIDQVAIVPLRDVLRRTNRRRDASFDYLVARARTRASSCPSADEVEANAIKLFEQVQHSYEEALQPQGAARAAAAGAVRGRRSWSNRALAQATQLAQLGLDDDAPESPPESASRDADLPAHHVRCQPAIEMNGRVADWVAEIRRLRDDGRNDAVRGGDAGPRRADHRAAEGIRRLRRAGRARRRRAVRGGARGRRRRCRAASGCPTPACRSTPRPTSSRRSGARPSAAAPRPRRSSPTCAI